MSELTRTALAIDRDLLEKFDDWMASHGYTNRSAAVRDLIRGTLVQDEWGDPKAQVIATLSLVYDHASYSLSKELMTAQHEDFHAILCSQHVHLDHDHCLEVILLRGKAGQLRRLVDAMLATRGVKAGKLTMLSQTI